MGALVLLSDPVHGGEEIVHVLGDLYAPCRHMLIDGPLTFLPAPSPIPRLIGWHCDVRAQFNNPRTRDDFNLHARLVKPVLAPDFGRQGDIAPLVYAPKPLPHSGHLTKYSELPQFSNSTNL